MKKLTTLRKRDEKWNEKWDSGALTLEFVSEN